MPKAASNLGQLLIVGFDGTELSDRTAALLRRMQPAGVILFARNIKSADQTWRLLQECRKCTSTPLFTCVDLEGGTVDRFRDVLEPAPSAASVFATADRKLYRKHGQILGESSRCLGFNVDFAPVLDLGFEASRKVMGTRAVSAHPTETVAYAREFLAGLRASKVLGCGKHFPGLGEGKLDSHHELPVIDKPMKRLWAEDIAPYRALRNQLPFVMVSHAAYPQVTKSNSPASLSDTWITGILRKRVGFRNLIVSDDLEMGGVLSAASIRDAAVQFIRAGGDLCLVCHREDRVAEVYDQLLQTSERDKKFARQVEKAASRVLRFKKKIAAQLRPAKIPTTAMIDKLSRHLWEFGEQVRLETLKQEEEQ